MRRSFVVLSLLLAFSAVFTLGGQAQQGTAPATCPQKHVCVVYESSSGSQDTIAIDPKQGHYQEIVVETRHTEVEDFDGAHTADAILLAPYTADGDSYVQGTVIPEDRAGIYADADLRDVYVLHEAK